jgi:mono/diheme cytochrome c family protein
VRLIAGVVVVVAVVAGVAGCGSGGSGGAGPIAEPRPRPAAEEPVSDPAEYRIDRVSRAAGETIFVRTGIGDPYRTGMAYPVFLALLRAYPDELGGDLATLATKFGFTPRDRDLASDDPDVREGLPIGMHLTTDPNTGVAWLVSSCALCHSERLRWPGGEQLVIGLGNKRIRIHDYDAAIMRIGQRKDLAVDALGTLAGAAAKERALVWPAEWQLPILERTVAGLRTRGKIRAPLNARVAGGPPGRVAPIESFALAFEALLGRPVPTGATVGWTKIPDVIGFPVRTTLSWDGAGQGPIDVLVVEADVAAGARLQWFWDHPLQGASLSAYLRQPAPRPVFPGSIDRAAAARGKALFTDHCTGCHGEYDATGRVAKYEESIVAIEEVGTDPARTHAISDAFVVAANDKTLTHGIVATHRTDGYVPPVLTNVWARAPYGHLGQWPSLAVVATPPAKRAVKYVVDLDAPLDLVDVGVKVVADHADPLAPGEYRHDGSQPGLGVQGHPFLAELGEKSAADVIEYLKTL